MYQSENAMTTYSRLVDRSNPQSYKMISTSVTLVNDVKEQNLETPLPERKKKNDKLRKKQSPVSTMNIHLEEMKISLDDENEDCHRPYSDFVQKPAQSSFSAENHHICHCKSYEELEILNKDTSPEKPPLRPKPNCFLQRSNTEPLPLKAGQGEEAMLNFAEEFFFKGDIKTAFALFDSLLKELEKKYGRCHRQVLHCVHKMGEACLISGQMLKAVSYFEEAIYISAHLFGPLHLDTANSMEKVAIAKLHLKDVEGSHDAYCRALQIKRNCLGLYHEEVAHIQTQLACIYFHQGELLSSQASFEEALDIYRDLSLQDSSWFLKAAEALCSLGSLKLAGKQYSKAIKYFREASMTQKRFFGIYHPSLIFTLDNLGYCHAKRKDFNLASEIYEEMLHIQITCNQSFNKECYKTLKKLILVYEKMNKIGAAIDAISKILSLQKGNIYNLLLKKMKVLSERLQKKQTIIDSLNVSYQ